MEIARYFRADAAEATEALAGAARARFSHRREHWRGSAVLDVVEIGPSDASRCLVVMGGVHGVEGLAASAVQASLVGDPLPLPPGARVVLLHGVNAYGMREGRRVNRENVDLNRNARADFGPREASSPASTYVHRVFREHHPRAPHALAVKLALGVVRYGYGRVGSAIAGGQTTDPRSVFFAGTSLQPEVELLLRVLTELVSSSTSARVIDLHSGIGKRHHLQFHGSRERYAAAARTFGTLLERGHGGDPFAVEGSILDHLCAQSRREDLDAFTFESGTVGALPLLRALQRENHFHHADPGGAEDRAAKQHLREVFVPADLAWREAYVLAAREACRRCLRAIAPTG